MKIELITPEQHAEILSIYQNSPELFLQNTGYESINKDKLSDTAKDGLKTIENILKKHIAGFSSFSNFRLSKAGLPQLRIQYNYNYDTNDLPFTGVGYILLDELLNGFSS